MNRVRTLSLVLVILFLGGITVSVASCHDGRCRGPRLSYDDVSRPLPIMSCGSATARDLVLFLMKTHPEAAVSEVFPIAEHYIKEAGIEGVNHDIAFCQMCLETNYLRFGGDVQRWQNNFGGIGATGGGVAGDSFKSVRMGIRAQIQHLKAYASKKRLRRGLVDPRFGRVRRGSAPYVENLAGTWAADPDYGVKIRRILRELERQTK